MRSCKSRAARLHITPENIEAAVADCAGAGRPAAAARRARQWRRGLRGSAVRGSWAACAEGLEHPHTHTLRPIVFDPDLAQGRDDVVLAHLNSRLVQMALRLLRAEVGASASTRKLQRVTARLARNEALDAPAVIVHARLLMLGGDGQRLHEEILTAGGTLREGRFQRMNVGEVSRALEAALPEPASPAVQRTLSSRRRAT